MVVRKSLIFLLSFAFVTALILGLFNDVLTVNRFDLFGLSMFQKNKENQVPKRIVCYEDTCYVKQLNDNVLIYLEESYLKGTQIFLNRKRDIFRLVSQGKLTKIVNNDYYFVDTMYYSYPYLVPSAKELLDTIGERFHRKLENTGLECTRFTLTSMLRTTSSVKRLRKWNRNSIKNSAHLHGTTFDISYRSFFSSKELSPVEIVYLGDVLGKVIYDLRREQKCFATYETWQTCYHVVCR